MELKASSITKKYNQRVLVNDVSLEIKKGEIVGLLGPNGAGKTTTFYILVGIIKQLKGELKNGK